MEALASKLPPSYATVRYAFPISVSSHGAFSIFLLQTIEPHIFFPISVMPQRWISKRFCYRPWNITYAFRISMKPQRFEGSEIGCAFLIHDYLTCVCMVFITVGSISEYLKECIYAFCASIWRLFPYSAAVSDLWKRMGVRWSKSFCFYFVLKASPFPVHFHSLTPPASHFPVHFHNLTLPPHTFLSTSKAWLSPL